MKLLSHRLFWSVLCLLLAALLPLAALAAPLKFWAVTGSDKDVALYRELAQGFEKETGIKVDVTPLAWGNFATKYFASMAAGLPPDIGVTNLGGPFDYGAVGGLVDLRAEFPEQTRQLEAKFNPGLLEMFTVGDKLFGIPSDLGVLVLYYRTDIFGQLGLKAPETWSEMHEVIARLEGAGYRYYFGWTNNAQWALGMYTMPYGLAGMRKDRDGQPEVTWNHPDYQKGVMHGLKLWHMHNSPGKDLGSRAIGMFRSNDKETAMPLLVELHSFAGNIVQTAPELRGKWAAAPWPRADDGQPFHVMGGTTYTIFRKSKMKKEAMKWLMHLHRIDVQRRIILHRADRGEESGLSVSPVREVWEPQNADLFEHPNLKPMANVPEVLRRILPEFKTVKPLFGTAEVGRMEANLLDQMGSFITSRIDGMAKERGVRRSEFIQRIGTGEFKADSEKLIAETAARLKQEYAKVQPQAEKILREENEKYEEKYGRIVADLPKYEAQPSILDWVKGAFLALVIGLLAFAGINPKTRQHFISYLFISVPLALAGVFVFIPALTALYLSFTDYHPVLPLSTARWIGAQNYAETAPSPDFLNSLKHTLAYAVGTLPISILISLVFAYLLNQQLRAERFWRFLYFSPLVTSVVSIALIFTQLFLSGKQGWLNALVLWLGLAKDPVPWLTSEHTFLQCVIVLAIWHGLAFTILVFLAGLQQIPEQLFEAAALDGASPARRFLNVAIPGLRPQIFFISVLGLMGSFQVFETIYVLAGKSGDAGARFGPNDSALTLVPLIYHTGFETFEMGKSAAYAYLLFFMILIFTVVQFRVYARKGAE